MRQFTCKAFFLTLDPLKNRNINLYSKNWKIDFIQCIKNPDFCGSKYGRSRLKN